MNEMLAAAADVLTICNALLAIALEYLRAKNPDCDCDDATDS